MATYAGKYSDELAKRINLISLDECRYFPKYFTIETCNNCNARCIMCPKGRIGTQNLQIMEDDLFNKIASELEHYSDWIEMICLNSDGEPLLDRKLSKRIKVLKDIGIKHVNISTNASLLTDEVANDLIDSGLDDLRISIDGYHKETFEKIRNGLNYDVVVENVKNFIKVREKKNCKMHLRIRMVELEENKEERDDWLDYWKKFVSHDDLIQIMPQHTWSGLIATEKQEKIDYYADKPCVSVFSSFTINYDGLVQLCDSDVEQKIILGDINSSDIREIWTGDKFETIRHKHLNAKRNDIEICCGCDHWGRLFKESNI